MTPKLSQLKRVPLREAWKREAGDFTPWLAQAENINRLSDALGLGDLTVVATEHWVGEFKLDILASDGNDQVVIENQLERTNHGHLGQIITYAAGINAKKVIWVAESFRPEHVAAMQFLNEHTTEDLNFFAVAVELYQIGDSPLAPNFEVVVKPNEWAKAGREQARAATTSTPTKQLQFRYWTELVKALARKAPHIRAQKPQPQHWHTIALGRSGIVLNPTVNKREGRIGVEVLVGSQQAKHDFKSLLSRREEIERSLGFELDWQELPDASSCRIASWRMNTQPEDESRWPEYIDWMVDRIVKMDAVFRPAIRVLP